MVTLALALSAFTQEGPQVLRSRTFTITVRLEPDDRPTSVRLQITRDGGRTWAPAAPERFRWHVEGGRLILAYEAPEDGLYGFEFQYSDDLGDFRDVTFPPEPGQAPFRAVWIDATPPSLEVLSPGEVYTNARSVRVDYLVADSRGVEAVTVWISPDGGRSWGRAEARQGRDGRGTYFDVTLPADGAYRVMLHVRDHAGNQTPAAPEEFSRFSPHLVARVRTEPPEVAVDGAPEIRTTRSPASISARFINLFDGELDQVLAWTSRDGNGPWTPASPAVTPSGSGYALELPLPEPGRYAAVIGFRDPAGFEWRAPSEGTTPDAWIVWAPSEEAPTPVTPPTPVTAPMPSTPPEPAVRWISPPPDEPLTIGQPVVLAWASEGTAVGATVAIEFRQADRSWVALAQDRPAIGVEVWTVPGPAECAVELRLRATMRDGARAEPVPLGPFWVRSGTRPEVAAARHHYEHAVLALAQEEWTGALASLTLALRAWPDYPDALRCLGLLHLRRGRPAEAMPYLLRARAAMRGDPEAYLNVATAHRELGLLDEAWNELNDGLMVQVPTDRWLLARYEQEILDLGDAFAPSEPEKAARCWRALLALPPVHHALHAAVEARLAPPPPKPKTR